MVRLTVVGRIRDAMPLAKCVKYTYDELIKQQTNYQISSYYKKQAEFILHEISGGALPSACSRLTIRVDSQYSFHCVVESGICFITLCDSSYPRKLAFHYLDDLRNEMEKLDIAGSFINEVTTPYTLLKLERMIRTVVTEYVDTRTQANLFKLNANRRQAQQELDVIPTLTMSSLIENRTHSDFVERVMAPQTVSPIWCSPVLEAFALKWVPLGIVIFVITVIIWASCTMRQYRVL